MRQLTYVKKDRLEWWEVAEPELRSATDAIVRPIAAARCDGDKVFLFHDVTTPMRLGVALHYLDPVTTDGLGNKPYQAPLAVGHECVGEVISCGDEVVDVRPGDMVVVPWAISCGTCSRCAAGLTSRCERAGDTYLSGYGFGTSMGPWGGMVSDLIRVPFADHMLVPVPEGVSPVAVASASDNIPDAWRTVAPFLRERPGAPVLVVGGGAESIGLYAAAIAVALGSTEVTYLDSSDSRLDIAAAIGAAPAKIPGRRGTWFRRNAPRRHAHYPITVDAGAHPDGLRYAIRSLAPGGVCTSVGFYFQKGTSIPLMQMYTNSSTLRTGVSHPRADLPEVLQLIGSGGLQPERITTVLAPWDDSPEAFLQRTTKVVVHRPPLGQGSPGVGSPGVGSPGRSSLGQGSL